MPRLRYVAPNINNKQMKSLYIELSQTEAIQFLLWKNELLQRVQEEENLNKKTKLTQVFSSCCNQIESQLLKDVTVANFNQSNTHLNKI